MYRASDGVFMEHVLGTELGDLMDRSSIPADRIAAWIVRSEDGTEIRIPAGELLEEARFVFWDLPDYYCDFGRLPETEDFMSRQQVEPLLIWQEHRMTVEEYIDPETEIENMTETEGFRLMIGQKTMDAAENSAPEEEKITINGERTPRERVYGIDPEVLKVRSDPVSDILKGIMATVSLLAFLSGMRIPFICCRRKGRLQP